MFIPLGQTINAVTFHRDNYTCATIAQIRGNCIVLDANDRYRYDCSSEFIYTLTIPAQNMTEYEQGSAWRCEYVSTSMYRSNVVILYIASKIHKTFNFKLKILHPLSIFSTRFRKKFYYMYVHKAT